jgi:hypothetical protein
MEFIYRLLVLAIFVISTVPLFAQAQQSDAAKLKRAAQKVVSIIKGDKAKTESFCQMGILGKQVDKAILEKDTKGAMALAQRVNDAGKQLGPEYAALVDALGKIDANSEDRQEIESMFDKLDASCPH